MTTISIYLYNQTFPQFVVNLIISDIIPSVNRFWKILSYSLEASRYFVHFASQISVRHLFFSGCNNYHWYFFPVNDKRSRRSWSYNHNPRLLLALHRIQLPDGYTLFHFIHSQLSIATLPDFSIITPARNLPDGFHDEHIIIHRVSKTALSTYSIII